MLFRSQQAAPLHGEPRAEDRPRAMALYDQALADYQRLGMPLYVQDVVGRRDILKA